MLSDRQLRHIRAALATTRNTALGIEEQLSPMEVDLLLADIADGEKFRAGGNPPKKTFRIFGTFRVCPMRFFADVDATTLEDAINQVREEPGKHAWTYDKTDDCIVIDTLDGHEIEEHLCREWKEGDEEAF